MVGGSRYIVGIDLGTSHAALAWSDADGSGPVRTLEIPQLVDSTVVDADVLLPTCLYRPLDFERQKDPEHGEWWIGRYARRRGQEVHGRMVASAKSWLCHGGVNRLAPILPWGSSALAEQERLSPVRASTLVLEHLGRAWDSAHPDAPLSEQQLVLTVPASFDQVARELTVRAAVALGLKPRLLEEPQAAFYDYLDLKGTEALERLLANSAEGEGVRVLVCDVGGGTTDLSLLRVRGRASGLAVDRVAVGRHLLLGGDNVDHALAHTVEKRLSGDERMEPSLFAQLVFQCRDAKERLLSENPPAHHTVTVVKPGAKLVGKTLASDVEAELVEKIAVDGFFPRVAFHEPRATRGAALVTFGLPYEREPAVTRHVARFLERHLGASRLDALLVNGGVFHSTRILQRLVDVVGSFFETPVISLEHTDPDRAVARGAAVYGRALGGIGLRIGGGAAHGYYVGLDTGAREKVMCVVPKGAKESERHAASRELDLVVGRMVRFDLYASDGETWHAPGEIVDLNRDEFEQLPAAVVEFAGDQSGETLKVRVEGELTPIGTLNLECVGNGGKRYELAFELRGQEPELERSESESRRPKKVVVAREADEAVLRVFGKGRKDVSEREPKDLLRELERLLGNRQDWPADLARALFDVVAPKYKARRRSIDHERMFWMLVGFCMRPGYGYVLDGRRVSLVAPLFEEGLTFGAEARSWQQFFIAWRRMAGGLDEAEQVGICDLVEPFIAPEEAKLRRPKGFKALARDEIVELVSRLERLPVKRRVRLSHWLLEQTWTNRDPRLWAAIGRIGARVPAYASAHHVLPPAHAEEFLDHLLREPWAEIKSAAYAAKELCRVTEDRVRDVSPRLRQEVARRLEAAGARPDWIDCVRHHVPPRAADQAEFLGEELPLGLTLGPA